MNLRAYLDAMDEEKIARVNLEWDDEQLRAWDGNFRNDGLLMLVCCDREVDMAEFREVLAEFLRFRKTRGPSATDVAEHRPVTATE